MVLSTRRIGSVIALLAALCLAACVASSRATTEPQSVYGVHVYLSNSGVKFVPAHLVPDTALTYLVTVWNQSKTTRTFHFANVATPTLSPGHKASFLYPFHVVGYVKWKSLTSTGKTFTGEIRVRYATPLPNVGVPGFQ